MSFYHNPHHQQPNGSVKIWTSVVAEFGPDSRYWFLLRSLYTDKSGIVRKTKAELCRFFNLTTSGLNSLLKKLQRNGLVFWFKYDPDNKAYTICPVGKEKMIHRCKGCGYGAVITVEELLASPIRPIAAKIIAQSLQVKGEKAAVNYANKHGKYAAVSTETDFCVNNVQDYQLTKESILSCHCSGVEPNKPQAVIDFIVGKNILVLAEGTNFGTVSQATIAKELNVSVSAVQSYLKDVQCYRVGYWSSGVEARAAFGGNKSTEVFARFKRSDGSFWTVKLMSNVYLGLEYSTINVRNLEKQVGYTEAQPKPGRE